MDLLTFILFIAGLGLLVAGAEVLVRGASRLAASVGVSPLVIGLTVVAYGTSAPELAVSVKSALAGQADIALGNVVGSNIFNVLFILGVAVLITPLLVSAQLIRRDVPVMIGVSLLLFVMALDGKISQREGALLLLGGIGYTAWSIWQSRRENQKLKDQFVQEFSYSPLTGARQTVIQIGYVLVGVGLLVLGSNWLVNGAVSIAEYLGVSQLIIGLTIVAAGTSLPEVATSVVASLRGQRDIAVGNVVGSNIFNILSVVGLAAFVSPQGLNVSHAALAFDLPVMVAVAIACLPIFFTGGVIARWEGALFLTYYLVYMFYLLLSATHSQILPVYTTSMLIFVLPVTVMTIGISLARALRAKAG